MKKYLVFIFIITFFSASHSFSQIVKEIVINGNERIPSQTIKVFSQVSINDKIDENDINKILKNLYETNFFKNITIKLVDNRLFINVTENPIIQNIKFNGIKSKSLRNDVLENLNLKERSSFDDYLLSRDKQSLLDRLRSKGYYFVKINISKENLEDNKINLIYSIDLGEKSKIKKITFIGNKVYKDRKLRNIIISEENKFWKFLSNRKYINQEVIEFDKNLLINFYKNKGYYNVSVNSVFAKMQKDGNFELIYNINSGDKIFFNELKLFLPDDFNENYYTEINDFFKKLKGKQYSINNIEKILENLERVAIEEEYQSITTLVEEEIIENKINLSFEIKESEKYFVDKINIYGNNVTEENVIRNQFQLDEGDPFNEILAKKSQNNIKSLGFFKSVNKEILTNENEKTKTINITVDEKPTGEILAGAGIGTSGGTATFSIKENNYLGKGIGLQVLTTVTENTIKGKFSVSNPNYKNSDKSARLSVESSETDLLKTSGYKSNKTGFTLGTNFEYLDDLFLGVNQTSYYEKISTNSSASSRQKSQQGNFWDTFIQIDMNYDKRNQKYQASEGFRSFYAIDLPVISETNTLTNTYSYTHYKELYEDNISSISFFAKSANSITSDDIKLSERLFIPGSKLRGFESGKVGPKDGKDFIGGNFVSSVNISSTLPQLMPNSQNTDFLVFFDMANVWGVDYDSSLEKSDKIRSSVGVGLDLLTILGPMNFSLSHPLSKASTDKTESFRFNLGTTF